MNYILGALLGAVALHVYAKIQRIENHLSQIDEFIVDSIEEAADEIHGQCTCPSEN
jgi:hypothetical protein